MGIDFIFIFAALPCSIPNSLDRWCLTNLLCRCLFPQLKIYTRFRGWGDTQIYEFCWCFTHLFFLLCVYGGTCRRNHSSLFERGHEWCNGVWQIPVLSWSKLPLTVRQWFIPYGILRCLLREGRQELVGWTRRIIGDKLKCHSDVYEGTWSMIGSLVLGALRTMEVFVRNYRSTTKVELSLSRAKYVLSGLVDENPMGGSGSMFPSLTIKS